jgi:hypothetical protein
VTARSEQTCFHQHLRRSRTAAAMLALCCLSACTTTGDFGRVRPSLQNDDIHSWLGPASYRPPAQPPWRHQLTEDERRLRDYAYPLIEPPYDRTRWYSALSHYGLTSRPWPYPDRAAYSSRLFQTPYRSQNGRYNRLIEDVRNDVTRLESFYGVARTVSNLDRKRERSLNYVSGLTAEEMQNTMTRIRENDAIQRWVRESVNERVESYRLALERLVIAAPSPMAVEAERALMLLQQRAGGFGV